MPCQDDAERTSAQPEDIPPHADTDLASLRAYLHRVVEALPETAVRTLARMMALTAHPPVHGDY